MTETNITKAAEPTIAVDTPPPFHGLETAPNEIKLAVDLIYLLESNEVDTITAIKALEIVLNDFKNK